LYRNWRMPDHADVYGLRTKEEALAKRHEILQGIISHLRQCVLRTLSEKITDSRPCDSNTISSFALNRSLIVSETQPWVFNEDWETMDGEIETRDGVGRSLEIEASSSAD
jgi:hypothetical protein